MDTNGVEPAATAGSVRTDSPADPAGTAGTVTLHRLLTIATLTPVQATYVASRVADEVYRLHVEGSAHGHVDTEAVRVDADGALSLVNGRRPAPRRLTSKQAADVDGLRGLVAELARNADRPVVRRDTRQSQLLVKLEQAGFGEGPVDLSGTGRDLGRSGAVADELAALVGHVAALHQPESVATDRVRPSWHSPIPVPQLLPEHSLSPHTLAHRVDVPWRRIIAAVATVLAILVAALLLKGPFTHTKEKLQAAATAPATASATASSPSVVPTPTDQPKAVPSLGASRDGVISSVTLRPLGTCSSGAACNVRVTVGAAPDAGVVVVSWHLAIVDRCTGRQTSTPARTMQVNLANFGPYDEVPVALPRAKALAVVAVTDSPVKVASAPILVGSRC